LLGACPVPAKLEPHGYVYAFHHSGRGWTKIGMTGKADEAACRERMKHYAKAHDLPRDGWAFVCFVATHDPRRLERRLHDKLRFLRVVGGSSREVFSASVDLVYAAILKQEQLLLDDSAVQDPEVMRRRAERRRQTPMGLIDRAAQRRLLADARRRREAQERDEDAQNAQAWLAYASEMTRWCARPEVIAHYRRRDSVLSIFRQRSLDREYAQIARTQPELRYPFPRRAVDEERVAQRFCGSDAFYAFHRLSNAQPNSISIGSRAQASAAGHFD
jgi:hypothetical protein